MHQNQIPPRNFFAPLEMAANPGEKARLAVPECLDVAKPQMAVPAPVIVENFVRSRETLFWAMAQQALSDPAQGYLLATVNRRRTNC